jgi:hypothetical protein
LKRSAPAGGVDRGGERDALWRAAFETDLPRQERIRDKMLRERVLQRGTKEVACDGLRRVRVGAVGSGTGYSEAGEVESFAATARHELGPDCRLRDEGLPAGGDASVGVRHTRWSRD